MAKTKLPEWINKEDWDGFVAMRRKMRKPLTERAINMALRALDRMRQQGHDPNHALQFTEYKGNQGVFPAPNWWLRQQGYPLPQMNKAKRRPGDF